MDAVSAPGDAEGFAGVGTMISGLVPAAPASVAVGGIVASLYDEPVMVAGPGNGTETLAPRASSVAVVLAAGLQAPVAIDGPKA
jgi:hypothetical protein